MKDDTEPLEPLGFSPRETSKVLRMGINQTYQAIRRGEIKSVRIGKKIIVPRAWLKQQFGGAQ